MFCDISHVSPSNGLTIPLSITSLISLKAKMMPFNNPGYPLINPLLSQPMLLGQMPIPRAMVSSAATSLVAPSLVQQMGVAPQPRPMLVPAGMGDPSAASPSTSNWSEHQANDGRVYYYNKVTKESVWSKPRELMTPQELAAPSVAGRGMWREYKTGEGRPYYYNLETKETTWSMPEGFVPNAGIKFCVSNIILF